MKLLNLNLRREFRQSLARFLSIVALITLGVFVLVGLKTTGPDMLATGSHFFEKHHLADAEVTLPSGLTNSDLRYLRRQTNVSQVVGGRQTDTLLNGHRNQAIRVMAQPKKLSTVTVVRGKLPTKSDQIALSASLRSRYHVGSWITLTNNQQQTPGRLHRQRFQVTGFINSADFIKTDSLGNTSVGTGQLTGFAILPASAFKAGNYQIARVNFNNTHGSAYSSRYENQVNNDVNHLQKKLNQRASQQRRQKRQKVQSQAKKVAAAKAKLTTAQQKLRVATLQAKQAQNPQLTQKVNQQTSQLTKQQQQLAVQQKRVKQAQQKLAQLDQLEYTVQGRNDYNQGYNEYGERANRIGILSNTFPLIFFAIASLVCYTTMGRMAEEKRIDLGTLRALGYSKAAAMKLFWVYGSLAALLGSIIGAGLGLTMLPQIIFRAYTAEIRIGQLQLGIQWLWLGLSVVIAWLCTTIPAWLTSRKELQKVPATLMVAKAPANGSRILLERVGFIWHHLPFSQKVTFRNLFRYKERMLMTIIGVLGCVALLITGFGIRDSLSSLEKIQYSEIVHYDVLGVFNHDATSAKRQSYQQSVADNQQVKRSLLSHYQTVTAKNSATLDNQQLTLLVPKKTDQFSKYVTLRERKSQRTLKLSQHGAIITEKLATLFNKHVGDYLTVKNGQGKKYRVRISGITEMYIGHYIYMSPTYYHKVFDEQPSYNTEMVQLKHHDTATVNKFSKKLTQNSASVTVIQSLINKRVIQSILGGLNNVVLVIIICASLLAFVVLYTLTNINVSERVRELATIKVLGFYPMETTMYIYRETFILTGIGILLGFVGGDWLHRYIMAALPPENSMSMPNLLWSNLGMSTLFTVIFSLIVMGLMIRKINRIDMLGALKSVD